MTAKTTQLTLALGGELPSAGVQGLSRNGEFRLARPRGGDLVSQTPNVTAYVQSAQLTPASLPYTSWSQDPPYQRQAGMLTPVSGLSVPVTGGQQIAPGQPVGVSGQRLRIQVSASTATFTPTSQSGGSAAAAGQVFVTGAFPPATDPATGNLLWTVTTLSGVAGTLNVPARRRSPLQPAASSRSAGWGGSRRAEPSRSAVTSRP